MPFTLTHTLAVLPLASRYRKLPLAALCIGAMVPDWSLFIPVGPHYDLMHSWLGLPLACLPLGLALFILFRSVYCRALVELMPFSLQRRLPMFKIWQLKFSPRELLFAAAGVAFGAASHLVWDAFTHQGRWGIDLIPVLSQTVVQLHGSDIQAYKLFQHGSSVLGLPLLAWLAWRWLRSSEAADGMEALLSPRARLALTVLLLGVPVMLLCNQLWSEVWSTQGLPGSLSDLHELLFTAVTRLGLYFFMLFNVYSVGLLVLGRSRRAAQPDTATL